MQPTKKKYSILNVMPIIISLFALGITSYSWINNSPTPRATKQEYDPLTPPVFLSLTPFTVTLPMKHKENTINKVLYVGMTLRLPNENQKNILTTYLPEVRSQLLLLFANQNIDELNTDMGKLKLVELVKQVLSRPYSKTATVKVDDVLFTDFIIR